MDYFNLKANHTTLKTEILAGVTTFTTMSYILVVNPTVLSTAGMDRTGVFVATIFAAFITTLIMAFYAKLPFALAPGLGMNAFFVHYIVNDFGFSWQVGLLATFVAGILLVMILRLNLYEKLILAIPNYIKESMVVGIGLAIFILGLQYANIITVVDKVRFEIKGIYSFQTLIATIGLIIMIVLLKKKVIGAILYGLLISYFLGIIGQLMGLYVVHPEVGANSLLPSFTHKGNLFHGFLKVAFQFSDLKNIFTSFSSIVGFFIIVLSITTSHFFDAVGTLFGLTNQLSDLDNGISPKKMKRAMYADLLGVIISSCMGTTATTTYAENSVGIASGARTGVAAVTVAICFGASLFFIPIFTAIPSFAVAPALFIAGGSLFRNIRKLDFNEHSELLVGMMVIVCVGLTLNLYDSLLYGIMLHVICKLFTKQKHTIHPYTYIIFGLALVNILMKFWS